MEYALEVKSRCEKTFIISLANGELQGYITTEEAAEEGGYEATNALFSAKSGRLLVNATIQLIDEAPPVQDVNSYHDADGTTVTDCPNMAVINDDQNL